MDLRHVNAVRVLKVIATDVINEGRRLYFEGALLHALLFRNSVFFLRKLSFAQIKLILHIYYFSALRVPAQKLGDSLLGVAVRTVFRSCLLF